MRNSRQHILALTIMAYGLFFLFPAPIAQAYDFPGWQHGEAGHRTLLRKARQTEEPMIIYFNADRCGQCTRLNQDYLETPRVSHYLARLAKVEINPDQGEAEKRLESQYGVSGFPTFLVTIPSPDSTKVNTFAMHPFGRGANMTVDRFVSEIQNLIARHYNRKADAQLARGNDQQAFHYFEMTLRYAPDNFHAAYTMGARYHDLGNERGDLELLRKAKENLTRALSINPRSSDAKKRLHSLKNL